MHKEGNSATWTVLDLVPQPPVTTTYKATFAVHEELELFAAAFREVAEKQSQLSSAKGWITKHLKCLEVHDKAGTLTSHIYKCF